MKNTMLIFDAWRTAFLGLFLFFSQLYSAVAQPSIDRSFVRLEPTPRAGKIYDSQVATTPLLDPQSIPGQSDLPTGFEMQLVASEPVVQQPIALAWDAKGRLWVAENYTFAEKKLGFDTKLSDRIIILEDTDGNGTFDSRKVFWDQGKKLTGIEMGIKGIWALAPPNLLFLSDENEDDLCDGKPQIILNGFNENMRHDMAHGLRFGPDGWLYGMHGASAISSVGIPMSNELQQQNLNAPRFMLQEDQPKLFSALRVKPSYQRIPMQGGIWRFNVKTSEFQVFCNSSYSPSGMDWDRFGNLFFVSTDSNDLWYALPNSHMQFLNGEDVDPSTHQFIPRIVSDRGEQYQGAMIYQSDQWPSEYVNQIFTLNVKSQSIQREELVRQGTSFVGKHQPDLSRWKDPWFRCVDLSTGPDGSVYVLDWSDLGDSQDEDGIHRQSGRVYRIRNAAKEASQIVPASQEGLLQNDFVSFSNEDLLNLIQQSNSWKARIAQRIFSFNRPFNLTQLQSLRKTLLGRSPPAVNIDPIVLRLRTLWVLHDSGNLDSRTIIQLIRSNPPDEIYAAAIKLIADQGLGAMKPEDTEVYEEILDSLGTMVSSKSGAFSKLYLAALQPRLIPNDWRLATLLSQSIELQNDRDFPIVMWHGIKNRIANDPMGAAKLCSKSKIPSLTKLIVRRLASLHSTEPDAIAWIVGDATIRGSAEYLSAVVEGMNEGYAIASSAEAPKSWGQLKKKIDAGKDQATIHRAKTLQLVFDGGVEIGQLIRVANDSNSDVASRRNAIQSIANHASSDGIAELWKLLEDEEFAFVVAKAIASKCSPSDAQKLVDAYPSVGPEAKNGIVAALASRPLLISVLLESVESKKLPLDQLDAASWLPFRSVADWSLLERARKQSPSVLGLSTEKRDEIQSIEKELDDADLMTGDASQGRLIWEKSCASCHRLFGSGGDVGPELTNSPRSNISYWLENIIAPYEQVATNHRVSIFQNQEGTIIPGVLLAESKETITIQTAVELWLAKPHEIVQKTPSSQSLMPEGLLSNMQTKSRIDLFRYLMSTEQVAIPPPVKKTRTQ